MKKKNTPPLNAHEIIPNILISDAVSLKTITLFHKFFFNYKSIISIKTTETHTRQNKEKKLII